MESRKEIGYIKLKELDRYLGSGRYIYAFEESKIKFFIAGPNNKETEDQHYGQLARYKYIAEQKGLNNLYDFLDRKIEDRIETKELESIIGKIDIKLINS